VNGIGPATGRAAKQRAGPDHSPRNSSHGARLYSPPTRSGKTVGGQDGSHALLLSVRQDMHLAWELEELRRLATGTMEIRSLAADAPAPRLADGTLVVSFKRRTGASLACFDSPACLPAPGMYTH